MFVPVPPLPGVVTVIVSVAPAHTVASAGLFDITGATGSATTVQDTWLTFEVQPVPVLLRLLSIRLVPVTAGKDGRATPHALHETPLSVEYLYSSVFVPVPPLPGVVTVIVSVVPAHTVASAGLFDITGATGSATTVQDTWLTFEMQPVPVLLRLLSIRLVPVTAGKDGRATPHALHEPPLSVEYLYSSVFVPVPPLPGVVTVIVSVAPAHTVASAGLFDITGATGSATTVQDTWLTFEVQPVPVLLRLLSIRLVPVTAGKDGRATPHALHEAPLSVEYLY